MARVGLVALLLCGLVALAAADYCTPGESCWPSDAEVREWMGTFSENGLVLSRDSFYQFMFQRYASPTPDENLMKTAFPGAGFIVIPGNEDDLVKAVKFAWRYRIRTVAKCSGHNANGKSTGNGVMQIQTHRLKSMRYFPNDHSIIFEAGCNHGDVYGFASGYNRTAVGGKYKTVCPAGCLTGGCHGPLTRAYGLGADNVLALRIVLYNGRITTASRTQNPELFNAMLGAGQSSFGIISRITVRTYPATLLTRAVAYFRRPQSTEENPNVLTRFFFNTTWVEALPSTLTMYLESPGSLANSISYMWDIQYIGTNFDADVTPAIRELLASPWYINETFSARVYMDLNEYAVDAYGSGPNMLTRSYATNVLVPPNQEVLDTAAGLISAVPEPACYIWYTYGGNTRNGTVGSFSHGMRTAMLQINLQGAWILPSQDEYFLQSATPMANGVYQLSPHSYINEYSAHPLVPVTDWKTRFYADYNRLLRAKQRYDPCNFFTVEHGPGSDMPAAMCR